MSYKQRFEKHGYTVRKKGQMEVYKKGDRTFEKGPRKSRVHVYDSRTNKSWIMGTMTTAQLYKKLC